MTTLVLGFVLLIVFGVYESYAKLRYPVMPMTLFLNREFISLVAVGTIAFMFYYVATLLWCVSLVAISRCNT